MSIPLADRFANLRSDLSSKDINLATRSDVEAIAVACITNKRQYEGCNLLVAFGGLMNRDSRKLDSFISTLMYALNECESALKVAGVELGQ